MLTADRSVLKTPSYRALTALVRRDFSITRSYRAAFALDVFFGIMNLIVFYYVSRTVTLRSDNLQGAPTYFAFASVGIVLTVVMQAATTGLARRIREEQLTGTLELLAMQPISSAQLAAGLTGFPFLFGTIRGALYIAFGGLFLGLPLENADFIGFGLLLAATAVTLSAIGIVLGGIVLVMKQGEALAAVVTFGFTLLSGALFPRQLLPEWLQVVGDVLPTRFALDGLRRALFEGGGWSGHLLALVLTSLALIPLAIWFLSALLKIVKKRGSLSQY
jgi:ABC-type multidrug transport system permease subunit